MASSLQGPSKSVSSTSLEGLLQCSVCYEQFDSNTRSPRQLQCHHTFCLQCLTSIVENDEYGGRNTLNCPTCRQSHTLGRGGIQQIPADHKIVQLMDVLSMAEKESDNICHKHGEQKLNFFCKTCEEPVCRDCTVVSHKETKGHEVLEISEALKEFTPQFINTRDTAQKISNELQARSKMFEEAIEELTKNEASEERQIREAFADYRTLLDEREEALVLQLRGGVSSDKEEIGVLRDVVDHEASVCRLLDEQFEQARNQQDIRKLFVLMREMKEWEKASTDLAKSNLYKHKWYEYKPQQDAAFRKDVQILGDIERNGDVHQQLEELRAQKKQDLPFALLAAQAIIKTNQMLFRPPFLFSGMPKKK